ncbi:MAG: aminodeoxychorismate synthase component I [Saprospiraceae bacterium]
MTNYNKTAAIALMNQWGAARRPFIFLTDFLAEKAMLCPLEEIDPSELRYSFSDKGNAAVIRSSVLPNFDFSKHPVDFPTYSLAFEKVKRAILAGDSFLLNLTFPTLIQSNLDLYSIFLNSKARYRLWLKDQFTLFSPEPFVRIQNGRIATFPMKGTISADLPQAKEQLLQNTKEQAEHATIVDMLRNDLSRVAKQVRVQRYRYIDEVVTDQGRILQTSSHIEGQLPADHWDQLGDILFALLPAGSISGAPKKRTLEIIQDAEPFDRGFYTGVCGIFDGQTLDSGVMIRFIESTPNGLVYKSGGGITFQSQAWTEYQEMIQKVYLPFGAQEAINL